MIVWWQNDCSICTGTVCCGPVDVENTRKYHRKLLIKTVKAVFKLKSEECPCWSNSLCIVCYSKLRKVWSHFISKKNPCPMTSISPHSDCPTWLLLILDATTALRAGKWLRIQIQSSNKKSGILYLYLSVI